MTCRKQKIYIYIERERERISAVEEMEMGFEGLLCLCKFCVLFAMQFGYVLLHV